MKKNVASAFAPATTGNVGVGFDILGVALKTAPGDTVTVAKTEQKGLVEIAGATGGVEVPLAPEKNTATAGLLKLLKDFDLPWGFKVKIKKGIPLGSGMGGSAASAVAGVVAANALLPKPLSKSELLKYAIVGESVASGSIHGDNVAPCLFGGLVLVQPGAEDTTAMNVVSIPFPSKLVFVVALPKIQVGTKEARGILKPHVALHDFVKQSGYLSGFICGCFQNDLDLIASSLKDILIEPQRTHLIQGFPAVQKAALQNGALGCTISGAGPAVFAVAKLKDAAKIKKAMVGAFNQAGVGPAQGWISTVNKKGASVI